MSTKPPSSTRNPRGDDDLGRVLEPYRVPLRGYCYRMLGSAFEAEDAVQETFMRAFRSYGELADREALRGWLYRIATNVCLTMLSARKRRALPIDLGPAGTASATLGAPLEETTWIEPMPDGLVFSEQPLGALIARESVRLALLAALQVLPPRQRAALILHEVLHWRASEVAELLETSVASTNSMLQRARATLAAHPETESAARFEDTLSKPPELAAEERALLGRYVDAFERWDVDALVSLLHRDATLSMPPFALWLRGADELRAWWVGPGAACANSRVVPVAANGMPAFASYKLNGPNGSYRAFALHMLELDQGRVTGHIAFLDTPRLFPLFGLPPMI